MVPCQVTLQWPVLFLCHLVEFAVAFFPDFRALRGEREGRETKRNLPSFPLNPAHHISCHSCCSGLETLDAPPHLPRMGLMSG